MDDSILFSHLYQLAAIGATLQSHRRNYSIHRQCRRGRHVHRRWQTHCRHPQDRFVSYLLHVRRRQEQPTTVYGTTRCAKHVAGTDGICGADLADAGGRSLCQEGQELRRELWLQNQEFEHVDLSSHGFGQSRSICSSM